MATPSTACDTPAAAAREPFTQPFTQPLAQPSTQPEDTPDIEQLIAQARAQYEAPPATIHFGGFVLAMCGGMINAISFLDLVGATFVSHLTGTSTKVGMRLAGQGTTPSQKLVDKDAEEAATAYYAILLVVFFVSGSCISGCLVARNAVNIGRSAYGFVMLIAASLLVISVFFDLWYLNLSTNGFPIGSLLAAMACGMQNAMVTSYAGAVVRTTHVTGTWTDIGLMQGRMFANVLKNGLAMGPVDRAFLRSDFEKWRILLCLAFGFIFGCYSGTKLQLKLGKLALLVPAGIFVIGGLSHLIYVVCVLRRDPFQQAAQSASHRADGNTQAGRNVMLYVDGDVYDLRDASFHSQVSDVVAKATKGNQELDSVA